MKPTSVQPNPTQRIQSQPSLSATHSNPTQPSPTQQVSNELSRAQLRLDLTPWNNQILTPRGSTFWHKKYELRRTSVSESDLKFGSETDPKLMSENDHTYPIVCARTHGSKAVVIF